jgi:hypothetical protein
VVPITPMANENPVVDAGDLVTQKDPNSQLRLPLYGQKKLGIITRIYILTHTKKAIATVYWIGAGSFGDHLTEELELISASRRFSDISRS